MCHPASMSLRSVAAAAVRHLPPRVRLGLLHRLGRFAPWEEGFDFTPPRLGPGEQIGPPDFVGIGVQKAGTTWWYELLAAHPGVSARPDIHKERHFLSRFGTAGFGPEDVDAYHGWFPRLPGTLAGEWTPDYLYFPWVPPLLARAAPETRLLVMLRDPVERFRSGLAHQLRHRASPTGATVTEAVDRGFYAAALVRWCEHFDPDRVLVLQYERCADDPAAELARSYRFLGLDESFVPPDLHRPVGATTEAKVDLDDDARQRLVDTYAPDVATLVTRLPEIDLSLWPNFATLSTP
jgi:Sulfotransferase family